MGDPSMYRFTMCYVYELLYSLSNTFQIDRKWVHYDKNSVSMYFRNKDFKSYSLYPEQASV